MRSSTIGPKCTFPSIILSEFAMHRDRGLAQLIRRSICNRVLGRRVMASSSVYARSPCSQDSASIGVNDFRRPKHACNDAFTVIFSSKSWLTELWTSCGKCRRIRLTRFGWRGATLPADQTTTGSWDRLGVSGWSKMKRSCLPNRFSCPSREWTVCSVNAEHRVDPNVHVLACH
jgi:hypothetical protein